MSLLVPLGGTQALHLPSALIGQLFLPSLAGLFSLSPSLSHLSFPFQPFWSQKTRLLCSNSGSTSWHQTEAALLPFWRVISPIKSVIVTPF